MTINILSKKIQLNGEELILDVFESESGAEINIQGKGLTVTVNGEVCYENYVKEEYKYLPSKRLRMFASKHSFDFFRFEDNKPSFCLYINGIEYDCLIREENGEHTLYMYDWLTSIEKIKQHHEISREEESEAKNDLENIKNDCKSKGYPLLFSHDGDSYDRVYTLQVPLSNFDGDAIIKCLTVWQGYNKKMIDKFIG